MTALKRFGWNPHVASEGCRLMAAFSGDSGTQRVCLRWSAASGFNLHYNSELNPTIKSTTDPQELLRADVLDWLFSQMSSHAHNAVSATAPGGSGAAPELDIVMLVAEAVANFLNNTGSASAGKDGGASSRAAEQFRLEVRQAVLDKGGLRLAALLNDVILKNHDSHDPSQQTPARLRLVNTARRLRENIESLCRGMSLSRGAGGGMKMRGGPENATAGAEVLPENWDRDMTARDKKLYLNKEVNMMCSLEGGYSKSKGGGH